MSWFTVALGRGLPRDLSRDPGPAATGAEAVPSEKLIKAVTWCPRQDLNLRPRD